MYTQHAHLSNGTHLTLADTTAGRLPSPQDPAEKQMLSHHISVHGSVTNERRGRSASRCCATRDHQPLEGGVALASDRKIVHNSKLTQSSTWVCLTPNDDRIARRTHLFNTLPLTKVIKCCGGSALVLRLPFLLGCQKGLSKRLFHIRSGLFLLKVTASYVVVRRMRTRPP